VERFRGFGWHARTYPGIAVRVNGESTVAFNDTFFRPENETANPNRGTGRPHHILGG
jgi:hypothetical protein